MNTTVALDNIKTVRGSGLTEGQLVLMGKGMAAKVKVDKRTKPWQGGAGQIWDKAQSDLNYELGYWH